MDLYAVIKEPLLSEKSTMLKEKENKYLFKVDRVASKTLIKQAVEAIFKVTVRSVHTSIERGKLRRYGAHMGRKPTWKKAIVKLQEGQKLEFFEGV